MGEESGVQELKQAVYVVGMGEDMAYRNLVRKPKEEGPLGRPRRIEKDYIRMDFQETGWVRGLDCGILGQ
jgi:hypothetical protein